MRRTRNEQLWIGAGAALAALIVVIGYFFLISPQRARTSNVQGQVGSARLEGLALQARITTLTSQTRRMASYKKALLAAEQALPASDDLDATPAFLRTLQTMGTATSTSVSSLTVGSPTAVVAAAPAATSSSSGASAPAAPAVAPAASLYSVAITADVSGSTPALEAFLTSLQSHQPRAVLVTGVTLADHAAPGASAKHGSTLNLTMTAFVRPSAVPTSTTPATPGAPAPSATSTP
jgi:hypothetical protein